MGTSCSNCKKTKSSTKPASGDQPSINQNENKANESNKILIKLVRQQD